MPLNKKIDDCYRSGKQLWIVSKDPLSVPVDYGIYRQPFGSINITSEDNNVHRTVFLATIPEWLIIPGSSVVDYSKIPKEKWKNLEKELCGDNSQDAGLYCFDCENFINDHSQHNIHYPKHKTIWAINPTLKNI